MAQTTAAPLTRPDDEAGVQFPVIDGRRSTSTTSRAVFAEATRALAPDVAHAIESARDWHKDYVSRMSDVEAVSASSTKAALTVAADGLAALHRQVVMSRGRQEVPLGDALRTWTGRPFATAAVDGAGARPARLQVPYRGSMLTGSDLRRRLDAWVARGVVEPAFADAIRLVDDNPDWLDARDLTVALVGAAAEMGPLASLCRWGATVVALDVRRPAGWQRILDAARAGSGRTLVPVANAGDALAADLHRVAGADLLTELPEIRAWLDTIDGPLVVGNYAYADGAAFVQVAAAADVLLADLCAHRDGTALAYLASPTDVFAVPMAVVDAARAGRLDGPRGRWMGTPLRVATGGRMFTPNYRRIVDGEDGQRYGLADSIVPQQGPNYALAKRLQRWRAVLARESVVTSANVAPATRTRSVTKNRVLAAAYAGASSFGVEIFEVDTSCTLMAAKLLHDLRNTASVSHPATPVDHPLNLFVDGAAHGGLWRLPWEPRSVLPLAAVEGLVRRRR
jgi:hypothetical protein